MPRVKRGVTARARHKKVFEFTKGHRGRRKNVFRVATQSIEKNGQYAYRDRRVKKRDFRGLWTQRINAGAREHYTIGQLDQHLFAKKRILKLIEKYYLK